jgi:chemotaxis protein methyltransferase CheR
MTFTVERGTLEAFRQLVARTLGLRCEGGQLDRLAEVLRARLHAKGATFATYIERYGDAEVRVLAELLTIGETSFFRTVDNFVALIEVVLPERMRARTAAGARRLHILSAGCSTGEEVYTLAMLLREKVPDLAGWEVRLTGVDINPSAIAHARRGRYSAWSLRDTPDDMKAKYFRSSGRDHQIDAGLAKMATFEERNLVADDPAFWQLETFDVIFCRNVIMYFTPEASAAVIERLHRSLVPGGYLVLGYAENLRGVSKAFHLRHTHDTFYYQKRDAVEAHGTAGALPWYDAIRDSAARIESLVVPDRTAQAGSMNRPVPELTLALDLLRRERYAEAIELVRAQPPEARGDADTELLLAVLCTNSGHFDEAEAICQRVLALDGLSGGAHYLRALAHEHLGDSPAARRDDETAIYLDATFAMPRMHLGLLAKRRGDREAAGRSLSEALPLLAREDTARILLFGGGFTREMLIEFCRSELRALEGP